MFDRSKYKDPWTLDGTLPPLRIRTDRLVLRCWEPSDAPLLESALDLSFEHLRAWLPWAVGEPSELEVVQERLARFRREFLAGEGFVYGLFDTDESEVVGGTGLMPRIGPGALEIGYWIRADRINRGLATEATRALTLAGLALPDVDRIEIHCDPANAASTAVPRKLGYRLRETRRQKSATPEGEDEVTVVFELSDARHLTGPA
jgi:RimJ/RimL family protein N-acetyltransferase